MKVRNLLTLLMMVGVTLALVTGCGGASGGSSDDKLQIGYVTNFGSHEWYQNIIKGAENTAKEKDQKFEWADANVDLQKQISQAENMLTKGADVLELSPVDPKGLSAIMAQAKEKQVPVITESNPIEGAETVVGIRNLDGGVVAGKWAGEYVKEDEDGIFQDGAKVLIVGLPSQQDTRDRVAGFKKGLKESGANYEIVQEVNGGGSKDQALKASQDAITANKDVNMIFGINDDSALGGTQAYEQAGLDPEKLVTIGFGVEGIAGKNALESGGPYKAGLAMFPEYVGRTLVESAEKAANGEDLPEHTVTPIAMLTPENLDEYYAKDGKEYKIKFDAVEALLEEQQ